MKILLISILLLMTGCMTMFRGTPHEYCQKHSESYASYDQCYSEETSKRKDIRNSMSHIGDGLSNANNKQGKYND